MFSLTYTAILLLSPQQRRHVRPQTSPVKTGSVFLLGGAVMGNRSVQTVQTKLMQSAVSCCALTYKQTHQSVCVNATNINTTEER